MTSAQHIAVSLLPNHKSNQPTKPPANKNVNKINKERRRKSIKYKVMYIR